MKKLLSLIMTLCMLLSVMPGAVLAEGPQLVPQTIGADENVIVVVRDADGNVIAQFKDDGTLTLTSDPDAASGRLATAYADVLGELHPFNMDSAAAGRIIKSDIDVLLEGMGINAYEMVLFALIDIQLPADVEALLTDGAYAEVILHVPGASAAMVTLFTDNGSSWQTASTTSVDDGISVRLPASGTLALFANGSGEGGIGIGEPLNRQPATENPSVTGDVAPQIVPFVVDGAEYAAALNNGENVLNMNYVVVTGVADRHTALDLRTYVRLDRAYNAVTNAANVGDLPAADGQTLAAQLPGDDLIVRDLFEVTAYGDCLDALAADDGSLEVTLNAALDPAKALTVIHSLDGITWNVLDAANVTVNDDGTVTLKLTELGVVAFLVEAEYNVDAQDAVMAP